MTEASSDRTVLIAMDGSHFAAYAFEWYVQNVHRKKDHVILLYCQEGHFSIGGRTPDPTVIMARYRDAAKKTEEMMESLGQRLKDSGINGTVHSEHGEPGHVIVKVAEEKKATLIVTGCRGQGTVRRTIMGSVSDYLIHHSHVPVIVCRHKHHCFQHGHKHKHHH